MSQKPIAVGLSLCEQVIIEEKTRNLTLVNSFTRRYVERFPAEPFPFVLFAILTDGSGEVKLEAAFQRLDTLEVIFRQRLTVRFTNPLQEIGCIFRVRQCSFPISGHYQVVLLAGEEFLAQRRFRIAMKEELS
jgi:hypothetical protein